MRIFVTGATGFIGSRVVKELLEHGHAVLGLARSEASARALAAAGAEVQRGGLQDLASLRRGASQAEGVIHLGFIHDFSKFQENCEIDGRAIEAMGSVLAGTNRPLIVTSGTGMGNAVPGEPAREDNPVTITSAMFPRAISEEAAAAVAARGVNVSVMRLPQVHDPVKQGLITMAIQLAREKIAGRRRTCSMWPGCTGWPWKRPRPAPSITRWRKKGSRIARYRKSLGGD
jgi:nucleoside-diphosphate-sugar epimerase